MQDIWGRVFTDAPFDMSRIGVPGLLLMLLGLAVALTSAWFARRLAKPEKQERTGLIIKLIGTVIVAVGALMAMKII